MRSGDNAKHTLFATIAPAATGDAGGGLIGAARFAGVVTDVTFIPVSTITGANTNTRKLELINRGQSGVGTTVVASLQFNSGVNATAKARKTVTLSGTAANLEVAEGDVLELVSSAVGTGLADPGGVAVVTITRH